MKWKNEINMPAALHAVANGHVGRDALRAQEKDQLDRRTEVVTELDKAKRLPANLVLANKAHAAAVIQLREIEFLQRTAAAKVAETAAARHSLELSHERQMEALRQELRETALPEIDEAVRSTLRTIAAVRERYVEYADYNEVLRRLQKVVDRIEALHYVAASDTSAQLLALVAEVATIVAEHSAIHQQDSSGFIRRVRGVVSPSTSRDQT